MEAGGITLRAEVHSESHHSSTHSNTLSQISFFYPSMEENAVLFNNNRGSANMASAGLSWLRLDPL